MDSADYSPMPQVMLTSPARLRGQVFVLTGESQLLGRAPASHLRVDEPGVAPFHVLLRRTEGRIVVEDLTQEGDRSGQR